MVALRPFHPEMACDVVVVGAGPVGLTTALLLQNFGHKVHIYERHAMRYSQPRAVGMFHQAIRAYAALGLLDRLLESGALQDIRGKVSDLVSYVDDQGQILAQFPINRPVSKSGTAHSYALHQPTLEEQLELACVEQGVHVHRSTQVANVIDVGDYVELNIMKSINGNTNPVSVKVNTRFVVGCDGANSVVRKSGNINFIPFQGTNSRWLVVDVIPIVPQTSYQWKDGYEGKQYLDPKRPRTSVPSPATRRRWEFMVMPNESSELAASDEFIWEMLSSFDCGPDTAIIERRTVYSITGGWVETFAKGRIALAGDAAHLTPQFLGQGLNSGLRDAKSLAWRLDFALRNPKCDFNLMLKDYSAEQLATTMQLVAAAVGIEKMLTITDPEQALARNQVVKQQRLHVPDLERVGAPGMHLGDGKTEYLPCCEPGTLFIQDVIELNGKLGFFDNVVGEGWCLNTRSSDCPLKFLTPETRKCYVDLLGGHSARFAGEGCCRDISGRYLKWFDDSGAQAVLVRPDYYIYGTAQTVDEIEGLVRSAIDRLTTC